MSKAFLLLTLALAMSSPTAFAQVEARPITEQEAKQIAGVKDSGQTEVQSPMLLEVRVSPGQFTSTSVAKQNPNVWTTYETAEFVCDKAVVRAVRLKRTLKRKDKVLVEIIPEVATDWFRQDIDFTVVFLASDGRELGKRTWEDLTIGNDAGGALIFGSSTKSPTLELEMKREEFLQLFVDDQRPMIRIVVAIKGEEEDEEDD